MRLEPGAELGLRSREFPAGLTEEVLSHGMGWRGLGIQSWDGWCLRERPVRMLWAAEAFAVMMAGARCCRLDDRGGISWILASSPTPRERLRCRMIECF